eukprot:gb/GEZN01009888.1/.p1 GENE.gb/GEZN01009888.1/~~gb/GEZN01009888.1/.p1  ORF type:complete len:346 (+),score=14.25 gb/GEZN01009888.1/:24-1040(+)
MSSVSMPMFHSAWFWHGLAFAVCWLLLLCYTLYTLKSSLHPRAFRNRKVATHNIPGIVLAVMGMPGSLVYGLGNPEWFPPKAINYTFTLAFLANTITGFVMIPKLPHIDPATKREFLSLVLTQLAFVPVVYGQVVPSMVSTLQLATMLICVLGTVTSVTNVVLYLIDYSQGKSQKICSGDFLIKHMRKQTKLGLSIYDHYVGILFQRGAEQTRMPANKLGIFVALTLVAPFPVLAIMSYRVPLLHRAFGQELRERSGMFSLYTFCTVGNMQVFHGTLAVRGQETVTRAAALVAATVVFELVAMAMVNEATFGSEHVLYLRCITLGACGNSYGDVSAVQ